MRNPRKILSRREWLLAGGAAAAFGARAGRAAAWTRAGADATAAPSGTATARTPSRAFDVQRFVADCREAARGAGPDAQAAVRETLARAISDRESVLAGLGAPEKGGLKPLYRSADLTILNIVWSPLMQLLPHEHNMWALIGIYTGREDNIFWRRTDAGLAAVNATALSAGSVTPLPRDVIHSVNNPIAKLTGAIHIYGGDFFAVHRSEWDPETLAERDWSIREAVRTFEESNARFDLGAACVRS